MLPATHFTLGLATFGGLSAVVSSVGSGVQPFLGLGAGVVLPGGPLPMAAFQGLLGLRVHVVHDFYFVGHFQLRAFDGAAIPGLGVALEYSF